jgi:asparagine synthase (glutamine-hydrolysing)
MDQPSGDGVNSYVVARAVGDAGLKVAISGLGGDEVFGGYPSFERLIRTRRVLNAWRKLPSSIRRAGARVMEPVVGESVRAGKLIELLAGDSDMASAYLVTRRLLSPGQRQRLCGDEVLEAGRNHTETYGALLAESLARRGPIGWHGWISYAESRTYMHDVLLRDTDQMGMASSVEVRVPLLDHVLAAYVVGLPDEVKRANGIPKRLLIESLAGLLPDEILRRPKTGFTLPLERWMRGALSRFCEERLGGNGLAGRGILNPPVMKTLWDRFTSGRAPKSWSRLWALVALEDWLANNRVDK